MSFIIDLYKVHASIVLCCMSEIKEGPCKPFPALLVVTGLDVKVLQILVYCAIENRALMASGTCATRKAVWSMISRDVWNQAFLLQRASH